MTFDRILRGSLACTVCLLFEVPAVGAPSAEPTKGANQLISVVRRLDGVDTIVAQPDGRRVWAIRDTGEVSVLGGGVAPDGKPTKLPGGKVAWVGPEIKGNLLVLTASNTDEHLCSITPDGAASELVGYPSDFFAEKPGVSIVFRPTLVSGLDSCLFVPVGTPRLPDAGKSSEIAIYDAGKNITRKLVLPVSTFTDIIPLNLPGTFLVSGDRKLLQVSSAGTVDEIAGIDGEAHLQSPDAGPTRYVLVSVSSKLMVFDALAQRDAKLQEVDAPPDPIGLPTGPNLLFTQIGKGPSGWLGEAEWYTCLLTTNPGARPTLQFLAVPERSPSQANSYFVGSEKEFLIRVDGEAQQASIFDAKQLAKVVRAPLFNGRAVGNIVPFEKGGLFWAIFRDGSVVLANAADPYGQPAPLPGVSVKSLEPIGGDSGWWAQRSSGKGLYLVSRGPNGNPEFKPYWDELEVDEFRSGRNGQDGQEMWVWKDGGKGISVISPRMNPAGLPPTFLHDMVIGSDSPAVMVPGNEPYSFWINSWSDVNSQAFSGWLRHRATASPLTLVLAGRKLDRDPKGPMQVILRPGNTEPDIKLLMDESGRQYAETHRGGVTFEFVPHDQKSFHPASASYNIVRDSKLIFPFPDPSGKRPQGVYTVNMTYRDDQNPALVFTWPRVEFVSAAPSYFEKPDVQHAIAAWLLGVLVCLATSQLRQAKSGWARLLPALSVVGPFIAGLPVTKVIDLDVGLLGYLVAVTLIGGVAVGLVQPALYRDLARIAPLDRFLPAALRWSRVRRQVFADYCHELRSKLRQQQLRIVRDERSGPSDRVDFSERYTPLPVKVVSGPHQGSTLDNPAVVLCAHLLDPVNGGSVFIESPGGRGKSALLREVVRLATDEFSRTGSTPLPVLGENRAEVREMASAALGVYLLTPERIDADFEVGYYLVVIDGLSETKLPPERLAQFRTSRPGRGTRFLISTRPDPALGEVVSADARDMVVEPQRLDEVTVRRFEAHYLGEGKSLAPSVRKACQGTDGTYLPILVRMAAIPNSEGIETIADIYAATFAALVPDASCRPAAQQLCTATYWRDGLRILAAHTPGHGAVIKQLLGAGVLVPAGRRYNRVTGVPMEVRFFHDSMQSFLTAEALYHLPNDEGWAGLFPAAGKPQFASARSDLVTDAGSELFQMCTQVFQPADKLIRYLEDQVCDWAARYDAVLTRDQIASALSPDLRERLPPQLPIRDLLLVAVSVVRETEPDRRRHEISRLYNRLAIVVWPKATGLGT